MIFSCCFLAVAAVTFWSCFSIDPRPYGPPEIDAVIRDLCEAKDIAQFLKCRFKNPRRPKTPSVQGALAPEPLDPQIVKLRKDPEGVTIYARLRSTRSASVIVRDGDSANAGKPIEQPIHVAIKYYLGARTQEERKEWYQMERKATEEFAVIKAGPAVVDVLSPTNRSLLGDDVLIVTRIRGPAANEVLQFILSFLERAVAVGRGNPAAVEEIHRGGLWVMNAQKAALGAAVHLQANKLRHCRATLNNMFFKLPTAEDLERYRSRLPETPLSGRDFLYQTKVLDWLLPDGSTVALLLEPDMVMFVNSLLAEKVEDKEAKHCILPSGSQQSDIWMVNIVNDVQNLNKIVKLAYPQLVKIKHSFQWLIIFGKRGQEHLTAARESMLGRTVLIHLSCATSEEEADAIKALGLV